MIKTNLEKAIGDLSIVSIVDDGAKDRYQEKFLMNNQGFLRILDLVDKNVETVDYGGTPRDIGNGIVCLGGWEFKVSKMVYPKATIKEVMDGWTKLIEDDIPVDLLFLTLFIRTILDPTCNTEAISEEPELVQILRLAYWYQRSRVMNSQNTFGHKVQEIREELGQGPRTKMEKYAVFSNLDRGMDTTQYYHEVVKPVMYAIRQGKAPAGFVNEIKEIRHSIYQVVSECSFYSLVAEEGLDILFKTKKEGEKNPDAIVHRIASEVKTIIDQLQYQDKIDDNLLEEILNSIQRNKLTRKINDALEQTAQIVVLDATGTSLGYALNLYVSQHDKTYSVRKSIDTAIELVESGSMDYVPILVFAQSVDTHYNFRLSMTMVPCPISQTNDNNTFRVDLSKFPKKPT
jgi:hypothetical protein